MHKKSMTKVFNNLHKPDLGPILGSFFGKKKFFSRTPALSLFIIYCKKLSCHKLRKSMK